MSKTKANATSFKKGHKPSEQSRLKMSQAKKGKPVHPNMLAAATIANTGRNKTPETIRKLRAANIGKLLSSEHKAKIAATLLGRKLSAEHKANIAISMAKGKSGLKGIKHPKYATKTGEVIQCRSSWEYKVAEYLDSLDLSWVYELDVLILEDTGEAYLPDFFIFDDCGNWVKVIEVKGWFPDCDKEKLKRFQDSLPVPLEIWDAIKLKELGLL